MTSAELARKLRAVSVAVRGSDRGGGSGVVWTSAGLIVTNAHVVRSRDPLVILSDGRGFRGTLVAHDRQRDLAILQIAASSLPAAEVGNSVDVQAGQLVFAVGNPLGIAGAVTSGIIHARADARWIQASVRLEPGNSGGLLADAEGRVIGINTMIQSGLALAIPSNAVAALVRASMNLRRTQAA